MLGKKFEQNRVWGVVFWMKGGDAGVIRTGLFKIYLHTFY